MKRRTLLLLGSVLVVAVAAAAIGVPQWRSRVAVRQDERLYGAVVKALGEHHPADALALLNRRIPPANTTAEQTARWAKIEVQVAASSMQLARLAAIYQRSPAAILADENASLLLARAYLHSRDLKDFAPLREQWAARPRSEAAWFALDVDQLILAGKLDEARAALEGRKFDGAADIPRLTRLAMLTAGTDLTKSWNLLAEANALDTHAADVRLFRGQILERIGKTPLARVEYVAAHLAEPANPWYADQLAEFYRRQGNPSAAIEVWQSALAQGAVDFIWLKQWFWSRVVAPSKAKSPALPESGSLSALDKALAGLPAESFWKAEWSEAGARLGADRQETFWLQLLEALRNRDEKEALQLVAFHKERAQSWAPELETALWRILNYRQQGTLNPAELPATLASSPTSATSHQFFTQLTAAAKSADGNIPAELDALLRGDEAFATTFICAGWMRAGVELRPEGELPKDLPSWLGYTDTQAVRYVRGHEAALAFAARLPQTPELAVLTAELQMAAGKASEARAGLTATMKSEGAAGSRAAWLLGMAQIESKEFDAAEKTVQARADLAATPTGQEMFARIAYLRGDAAKAEQIYRSIGTQSVEARAFLARRAFAAKDWANARRLTTELIELMPDQIELRENLVAIDRAEHQP